METTVVSSSSSSTFHVVDSSSVEVLGDLVLESHTPMEVVEETTTTTTNSGIDEQTDLAQEVVVTSFSPTNVEPTSSSTTITTSTNNNLSQPTVVNIPVTSKDVGTKIIKPIYLIPKSGGGLSLAGSSGSGGTVNKVVLASNSPALAGKPLVVKSNDGKGIPIVMKGQYIGNTGVGGTTTGGHIITKVILTTQPLTGQSTSQVVSLASINSPVTTSSSSLISTVQPVKIDTGSSAVSTANMTTSSPAKTQIITAASSKSVTNLTIPPITVNKIALSQKAPTKIMIPVNVGKSPQKIAPAPSGTPTAQVIPKATVLSTVIAGTSSPLSGSGTHKLNTVMASPTKVIIKPSAGTLDGKKTVLTTSSVGSSSNSTTTVKQVVASHGTTIGVQPIQVPGSKLSYIRLVTTQPSSSALTGLKAGGSESTAIIRHIAPATSTATSAVSSSQVKLALPLTTTTGQIINRPIMASKPLTGQRILIPASSLSNVTQIRQSAGSITVPASALAHLPPGTTLYSSGGNLSNIVMLPAQYVTQLQSQTTQPQTIVASGSSAAVGSSITTTAARTPVVIAPSIQTQVDAISTLNQTYATAVAITSSSASSHDKSHSHSSRNSLNG
ncbi:hypothetical protein CHUAL_002698 [Chamberlinius hualienensis]